MLQFAENFPMGVQNDVLSVQNDSMKNGEMLVMFTDGLSDLTDADGQRLGTEAFKERMKGLYQSYHALPATAIGAKLSELLDSLEGAQMAQDDRTFLLARRT